MSNFSENCGGILYWYKKSRVLKVAKSRNIFARQLIPATFLPATFCTNKVTILGDSHSRSTVEFYEKWNAYCQFVPRIQGCCMQLCFSVSSTDTRGIAGLGFVYHLCFKLYQMSSVCHYQNVIKMYQSKVIYKLFKSPEEQVKC